jgi:hypothetical protein
MSDEKLSRDPHKNSLKKELYMKKFKSADEQVSSHLKPLSPQKKKKVNGLK